MKVQKTPIPDAWSGDVLAWLDWLRAAARPLSTLNLRRTQINRLARHFPDRSPWSITGDELAAWVGSHDWDSTTIRSHRSALRSFYDWGKATGRTSDAPAAALPSVRAKRGRPRPAREGVWKYARDHADQRDALMIRLGAEMGLRCVEISRVHSDDLVQSIRGWKLTVTGKGGHVRVLPCPDGLAAVIRSAGGYLFPGQIDGHLSAATVSKRLSRALGAGTTGHQLRHRFGSAAFNRGGKNIRAVQDLLGHTTPETTAIYTEVEDDDAWDAVLAAAS